MTSTLEPLYLGFDLSTQQLKALSIDSNLNVAYEAKVDFDADLAKYGVRNGVHIHEAESEVIAPVAMWLEAVDLALERLKNSGMDFRRVMGISGAGQQHGSVYWSQKGEQLLADLDPDRSLVSQLSAAFAHPWSPNWQDASTQAECDSFDACLGSADELARMTGSKAHHRFTGPQVMRFCKKHPEAYRSTRRISLVSSFLASIFLGRIAEIDISDVCGMNLWDIAKGAWSEPLLKLTAGDNDDEVENLRNKLGVVRVDGGGSMGSISPWLVARYGFSPTCAVAPFTGDNPSTILALPLRPLDAIVSLGTSTTFLMSTPNYVPDPSYHFFNHPTTPGLYMFMLCYKNGGLARERVRDKLLLTSVEQNSFNTTIGNDPWATFNAVTASTPPLGKYHSGDPAKLGLYFPLPEIVPNVRAGTWRFILEAGSTAAPIETAQRWNLPRDDARAIVESQILSLRLRSRNLVLPPAPSLPPQARRIYLVGGGATNPAIARIVGEILGGAEGVYTLNVGGNACALGAAYKALWAMERGQKQNQPDGEAHEQTFEALVAERWTEEGKVRLVDQGYRPGVWEQYGDVLGAFAAIEQIVTQTES
ncbi:hypothetical protein MMC07_001751 [Pseudocyphellaria aurata]|nr:hypothetical protein [Pseudocyphellaria aurata]